jgi:hypothetical protein
LVKRIEKGLPKPCDELLLGLIFEYGLTQKDAQAFMAIDDGDRMDYLFAVVHLAEKMCQDEPKSRERMGHRASTWYVLVSKLVKRITSSLG